MEDFKFQVTTPADMAPDLSMLEKAVKQFEAKFKSESKGRDYYHLVIDGELNRETCNKVGEIYRAAGWPIAKCKTSSDNNERPGLTGLQLQLK